MSATVVASFCGHFDGKNEMLDLVILWRGAPGWFRHGLGGVGGGGSHLIGGGTIGVVSEWSTYGDVTIGFDANFDTHVATVGTKQVSLLKANTFFVERADGEWRVGEGVWTKPDLPVGADWNVAIAQRSRAVLDYLQCDVAMPPAPPMAAPVLTVCEKLGRTRQ